MGRMNNQALGGAPEAGRPSRTVPDGVKESVLFGISKGTERAT